MHPELLQVVMLGNRSFPTKPAANSSSIIDRLKAWGIPMRQHIFVQCIPHD
jgi:hypothetical protein